MTKFLIFFLFLNQFFVAKSQNYSDSVLVASFHQGRIGRNCASISVIKSAIQTFGIDSVVNKIQAYDTFYIITLKNGANVNLSKSEERLSNDLDDFACDILDSTILKKAKFYYAVMAKRKQLLNSNQYLTYKAALKNPENDYLLLIEDTQENIKLLGLEHNYEDISLQIMQINNFKNIIITSYYHSAYSSLGKYDQYGELLENSAFKRKHHGLWHSSKINNAYRLVK